jgi:putative SOS response-associated peptidase YedK
MRNFGTAMLRKSTTKSLSCAAPRDWARGGLWDEWKNRETGERIKSCAMIITEPNDFVAEVHDRMPVLLQPEQFDHWLSGDMTVGELKPAPNDDLQRWMVSKRVNSSKAEKDDPTLVEPVQQAA